MKMKMNGIRKYSGYIVIAVVVVFLFILLCYVNYNSLSSKESFEEQPRRTDTLYIDGSNNIINSATGKNFPGFKALYRGKYMLNGQKLGKHSVDVIFPPSPPPTPTTEPNPNPPPPTPTTEPNPNPPPATPISINSIKTKFKSNNI